MDKTIQEVESLFGEVSVGTMVAMVLLSIMATWAFITKIWPTLKNLGAQWLKRRDEKNAQRAQLKSLSEWKNSTEKVLQEMCKNQEAVATSLESILKGQDLLMDAQKATFDVLTQMLTCMSGEKDTNECVQEALGTINKFLIHEHGRVQ